MVTNLTPPKKRGAAPAKAESGAVFPPERAQTKPAAGKQQLLLGSIETGAAAESLENTMRLAMKAAGTDEAGFRKLPNDEQLAFLAQARGVQRPEAIAAKGRGERREVSTGLVFRSPWNRKHFADQAMGELVQSVRKWGVLQPALVRPFVDSDKHSLVDRERVRKILAQPNGEAYELIAGERRWRAAEVAGVDLPIIIRRDCSDEEVIELQAIENLQREDPNPIETGEKYQQLMEVYGQRGLQKEEAIQEIERKLNVGRSTIYDGLRLLKLPEEAKTAALEGRLPASHAREISKLEHDRDEQIAVTKFVLQKPKGARDDGDRDDNGLLSFRMTKEVVKERLQVIENRVQWNKKREEFEKQKLRVLTPEENKKWIDGHIGNGYWYFIGGRDGHFVKPTDTVSHIAGAQWREYQKLWKKPPPAVLGQTPFGTPVIFYEKAAADEAVKTGGKLKKESGGGGGGRQKSPAEVKADETRKKRDLVFLLALEQIGLSEGKVASETDEFWRILGRLTVPTYLNQEQTKQICRLNGWDVATFKVERLGEYLGAMKGPQLRAFVLQVALYLRAQPEHWKSKFDWHAQLQEACGMHGVSLYQLGLDLDGEANQGGSDLASQIVELLRKKPGENVHVRDICSELNVPNKNVYICLATKLKNDKRIRKVGPALYTAVDVQPSGRKGKK